MKKLWKCLVCGQTFEGDAAPVPCPVCGAGEDAFEALEAPAPTQWKCLVCGQIFEGSTPPVPCPVCGAGTDAFQPVEQQAEVFHRDTSERIVLIGGGVAALEAAKALRARNALCSIRMVCGEGIIPYNRAALSDVVSDGYSFESIALESYDFFGQQRIELICDARAVGVNATDRLVMLSDGRALPYDQLLLATGASPFNPIQSGEATIPCQCLRTFADAMTLIERAQSKRVLVVGGGILGLEAALALREHNAQVTVLELSERILPLQSDADGSRLLQADLERLGICFLTGKTVKELTASGAILTDGSALKADLVLASIGVRSNVSIAREMGLSVERGIVVDDGMATSLAGVYAAGDCAQFDGRVAGLWQAALTQGQVAGARMAGDTSAHYAPVLPATALETGDIKFFSAGTLNAPRAVIYTRKDAYTGALRRLYMQDNCLVGVQFYRDTHASGTALSLIGQRASFDQAASLLG